MVRCLAMHHTVSRHMAVALWQNIECGRWPLAAGLWPLAAGRLSTSSPPHRLTALTALAALAALSALTALTALRRR